MAKRFERALEAATEQTLIEPNWEGILECVDMIRGSDVPVKEAIPLMQKRYHSANPHIAHHGLLVLEACVKNCGKKFHVEIATREFMDDLKNMVIGGSADKVKEKVLELIQCWSSAFRDKPEYKIVVDTHNLLKMNGFEFPALKEADAMFMADSAPDWVEGDNCYRCRTEFGMFTRKHHCRACGQIFCDKCSSKQMLLPQFGIEKRVRVCEACFDKRMTQKASSSSESKTAPTSSSAADEERERARLQELMDREAEELQLALAISQSEAEAKEQSRNRNIYSSMYSSINGGNNASKVSESEKFDNKEIYRGAASSVEESVPTKMENDEPPMDSVLAKYLDRDYWERKRMGKEEESPAPKATAPPPSEYSMSIASNDQQNASYFDATPDSVANGLNGAVSSFDKLHINGKPSVAITNGEQEVMETMNFCKTLKDQVDTMDNRMRSNLLRGRSIINDSAIHSLFAQLTYSHANVLGRMTKLEGEREYYETLQDHLAHIQEARQAVNALREEHMRQKEARMLEEQQQRRAQMQHTLEIMRQKKHETLLYQRHLALQRFQEQEQQMQQRRFFYQQQHTQIAQQQPMVHQPAMPQQPYYSGGGVPPMGGSPATVMGQQQMPYYPPTQHQTMYNMQSQTSLPASVQQQMPVSVPPQMPVSVPPQMPVSMPASVQQQMPVSMSAQMPVSAPPSQPAMFSQPPQPVYSQQPPQVMPTPQQHQTNNVPEDLLISFD